MKIIYVEPERTPTVREIDGTLEEMQALVGGTIQAIYPFEDAVALICNDEGKLLNLPMCRTLPEMDDIICGRFFVCGAPADGENFTSLTDEQIEKYMERFHFPELFLTIDDEVVFIITDRD